MSLDLSSPVSSLYMVGPIYAKKLAKLNIATIEDLLLHLPHRYDDFRLISPINKLQAGETVTIQGEVIHSQNVFTRHGKKMQKATIADSTGHIDATWFNQPYITSALKSGLPVSLSGKVDRFGPHLSLLSPEYEIIRSSPSTNHYSLITNHSLIHTARLVPIYPETAGVSSKWLRSRIAPLLSQLTSNDHLPSNLLQKHHLIPLAQALMQIHFPTTLEDAKIASKRLAFDELFQLHLTGLIKKHHWQKQRPTHPFSLDQEKILQFIHDLPFTLTQAQKGAVKDVLTDLGKNSPMNRLLIGDVGSGKTVVAAIAMYAAFLNGFQSLIMAPTQILAHQHEQTLRSLLEPLGVKINLVTAAKKLKPKKSKILSGAEGLKPDLLVGTHALLHHPQYLENVGLIVIDEQHRFGVAQRGTLLQSAAKTTRIPHTLSMTATPIPRTIALTIYGNVDVSYIDELPAGRLPVKTWVVPPTKRQDAYRWIANQIKTHHTQAFIVCPLIEESAAESLAQVKAATIEYEHLKTAIFPELKLDLLHGKMKTAAKEDSIHRFAQQETDILVATPVIEVGLDIPRATIMVIEAAERFGLAQLHQLRGRVGRRHQQAYCLLFSQSQGPEVISRLKTLETQNSGQALAEIDLKLRGPGELYGTRQHGFIQLKAASLSDTDTIHQTRLAAEELLAKDEELIHHPLLKAKIDHSLATPIEPN